jgi:hypothetical protein
VDGTTTVVGGGEEGTTTAEEGAGFCTTVSLWKPQAVSARERRARQANAFMIVLLQGISKQTRPLSRRFRCQRERRRLSAGWLGGCTTSLEAGLLRPA